ncbi:hypothetical protein X975_17384, partial [Stegodyphus mimosarum]
MDAVTIGYTLQEHVAPLPALSCGIQPKFCGRSDSTQDGGALGMEGPNFTFRYKHRSQPTKFCPAVARCSENLLLSGQQLFLRPEHRLLVPRQEIPRSLQRGCRLVMLCAKERRAKQSGDCQICHLRQNLHQG